MDKKRHLELRLKYKRSWEYRSILIRLYLLQYAGWLVFGLIVLATHGRLSTLLSIVLVVGAIVWKNLIEPHVQNHKTHPIELMASIGAPITNESLAPVSKELGIANDDLVSELMKDKH